MFASSSYRLHLALLSGLLIFTNCSGGLTEAPTTDEETTAADEAAQAAEEETATSTIPAADAATIAELASNAIFDTVLVPATAAIDNGKLDPAQLEMADKMPNTFNLNQFQMAKAQEAGLPPPDNGFLAAKPDGELTIEDLIFAKREELDKLPPEIKAIIMPSAAPEGSSEVMTARPPLRKSVEEFRDFYHAAAEHTAGAHLDALVAAKVEERAMVMMAPPPADGTEAIAVIPPFDKVLAMNAHVFADLGIHAMGRTAIVENAIAQPAKADLVKAVNDGLIIFNTAVEKEVATPSGALPADLVSELQAKVVALKAELAVPELTHVAFQEKMAVATKDLAAFVDTGLKAKTEALKAEHDAAVAAGTDIKPIEDALKVNERAMIDNHAMTTRSELASNFYKEFIANLKPPVEGAEREAVDLVAMKELDAKADGLVHDLAAKADGVLAIVTKLSVETAAAPMLDSAKATLQARVDALKAIVKPETPIAEALPPTETEDAEVTAAAEALATAKADLDAAKAVDPVVEADVLAAIEAVKDAKAALDAAKDAAMAASGAPATAEPVAREPAITRVAKMLAASVATEAKPQAKPADEAKPEAKPTNAAIKAVLGDLNKASVATARAQLAPQLKALKAKADAEAAAAAE